MLALLFFLDDIDLVQTQDLPVAELWYFLPFGYLVTILIETPILLVGLSPKVSLARKFFCGAWLTACTYPIVVLVLPTVFFGEPRWLYLLVAETFAPVGECLLFWLAFRRRLSLNAGDWVRCLAAITLANLASFGTGEVIDYYQLFALF